VFDEAVRLRRLNERDDIYRDRLKKLRKKCALSFFNLEMVDDMLKIAFTWT